MYKILFTVVVLLAASTISAQVQTSISGYKSNKKLTQEQEEKRSVDFGFGVGSDHGGIGVKATFTPAKYFGFFGAAGYYFIDFGWQTGLHLYLIPKTNLNNIRAYFKVMYGTNRMIRVDGAPEYDKTYVGVSPGAGLEFRFGETASHGINLDFNVPISSSSFKDDYETVKNDPEIDITHDKFPFTFSIGYHFEL